MTPFYRPISAKSCGTVVLAACCWPEERQSLQDAQEPLLGSHPAKTKQGSLFVPSYPTTATQLPDEVHIASTDTGSQEPSGASEVVVTVDHPGAAVPATVPIASEVVVQEVDSAAVSSAQEAPAAGADRSQPGDASASSGFVSPFAAIQAAAAGLATGDSAYSTPTRSTVPAHTEQQDVAENPLSVRADPVETGSASSGEAALAFHSPTTSLRVAASDASSVFFDASSGADDVLATSAPNADQGAAACAAAIQAINSALAPDVSPSYAPPASDTPTGAADMAEGTDHTGVASSGTHEGTEQTIVTTSSTAAGAGTLPQSGSRVQGDPALEVNPGEQASSSGGTVVAPPAAAVGGVGSSSAAPIAESKQPSGKQGTGKAGGRGSKKKKGRR